MKTSDIEGEDGFEVRLSTATAGVVGEQDIDRIPDIMSRETARSGASGRHVYGRYGTNSTVRAAEAIIARQEQPTGAWAQLIASGMGAIEAAVAAVMEPPPRSGRPLLYPSDSYGGTLGWAVQVVEGLWGVPIIKVDISAINSDPAEFLARRVVETNAGAVLFETQTNPLMRIIDPRPIVEAARKVGAVSIADNTFATSKLIRPLEYGVDLVVHSVTKYIAGHGTIMGGVVIGRSGDVLPARCAKRGTEGTLEAAVRNHVKFSGSVMSPRDAFALIDQMKTFDLRVERANENAGRLAEFLAGHAKVAKVYYPGLAGDPGHSVAAEIFDRSTGYGAMVTFETVGEHSAVRVLKRLMSVGILVKTTLGDCETTTLPVPHVFGKERFSDSPEMVRVSVGIERSDNLIEAFGFALDGT